MNHFDPNMMPPPGMPPMGMPPMGMPPMGMPPMPPMDAMPPMPMDPGMGMGGVPQPPMMDAGIPAGMPPMDAGAPPPPPPLPPEAMLPQQPTKPARPVLWCSCDTKGKPKAEQIAALGEGCRPVTNSKGETAALCCPPGEACPVPEGWVEGMKKPQKGKAPNKSMPPK